MVRRLTLVAALAVTLATPAPSLFDTLWIWATSLLAEEPAAPPATPPPTTDDDKGYSIDPDG